MPFVFRLLSKFNEGGKRTGGNWTEALQYFERTSPLENSPSNFLK